VTLVLGVDGGNSKAIALVADSDGSILGAARRLGSADIYAAAGAAAAVELVEMVMDEALEQARAGRHQIGRAVFSMAGADWPEDIIMLERTFGADGLAGPIMVVNDAIGALAGAVPEGPAVVVSIGTGAATGARGPDGVTWHSSFWQSPHGAVELAQRMLSAVVRSELGIESPTMLRDRLLAITGGETVEAALHRFTRRGAMVAPVGPMVRALLDAAEHGDAVATAVVREHGTGLGAMAAAAARRVDITDTPYTLSFCGGLARLGPNALTRAAVDAIHAADQAPILVASRWEPAIGALVIGLTAELATPLPEAVAARLDASAPHASLYDSLNS
jgi:N-acetylglucosamine kinase-like BadF-type ATPase